MIFTIPFFLKCIKINMSDTQNLLKIQSLIDEHKETISDGDYVSMVNSLMNLWEFKQKSSDSFTTDEATRYIRFLESELKEADEYFSTTIRRISHFQRLLQNQQKKINELEDKLKERKNE